MIDNPKLYQVAKLICHQHGMDWTDPRTGQTHRAPPTPTDSEIEAWCNMVEKTELDRTFARDDLAPGNAHARRHQALMLHIVRRVRGTLKTAG